MIFVTLAAIAAYTIVIVALLGVIRSQQRAHARREDLLVNQLLHAAGKTWQPSPAATGRRDRDDDMSERAWTATPEQYPLT